MTDSTVVEATKGRTLIGQVVSNKMDRTITVLVERQIEHPIYRKYMKRSTRLFAHDERNECLEGDVVAIQECRPISKNKAWRLQKVLERAPQA